MSNPSSRTMTKTHMQKMEIRKCTIMTLTTDMSGRIIPRRKDMITRMDERRTTMVRGSQ